MPDSSNEFFDIQATIKYRFPLNCVCDMILIIRIIIQLKKVDSIQANGTSDLVKKADYKVKIKDIKDKFISTSNYKRFKDDIINNKIKIKRIRINKE